VRRPGDAPSPSKKGGCGGLFRPVAGKPLLPFAHGQQSRRPAFGRHVPSSARDDRGCDPGDRSKYGCDPAHEPSDGSPCATAQTAKGQHLRSPDPMRAAACTSEPGLSVAVASVRECERGHPSGGARKHATPSVLGPVFLSLWPDGNRPAELKSPSQCWLDPVGRLALERGNKVRLPRSIQIIRQFNWWVRSRRHNATSSR
jgi:hypothetical protein